MSRRLSNAKGGHLANAPKAGVAESWAFIWAQKARGVPVSAVARMMGRNVADVAVVYDAPPLVAVERAQPSDLAAQTPPPVDPAAPDRRPVPRRALDLVQPILDARGVSWAEVARPSKARRLTEARQAACATLREAGFSLTSIGAYLGTDHASVHHGIRAHRARLTASASAPSSEQGN